MEASALVIRCKPMMLSLRIYDYKRIARNRVIPEIRVILAIFFVLFRKLEKAIFIDTGQVYCLVEATNLEVFMLLINKNMVSRFYHIIFFRYMIY